MQERHKSHKEQMRKKVKKKHALHDAKKEFLAPENCPIPLKNIMVHA